MKQIKFTNRDTLGLPRTPSRWVGEPQYKPITSITMSCGGGMGGSKWHEYVERVEEIPSNSIITLKRIGGHGTYAEDIKVNTSFIVSAEDLTLVTIHLDSDNPHFRRGLFEYKVLVRDGHKVRLSDYYDSDCSDILTDWSFENPRR